MINSSTKNIKLKEQCTLEDKESIKILKELNRISDVDNKYERRQDRRKYHYEKEKSSSPKDAMNICIQFTGDKQNLNVASHLYNSHQKLKTDHQNSISFNKDLKTDHYNSNSFNKELKTDHKQSMDNNLNRLNHLATITELSKEQSNFQTKCQSISNQDKPQTESQLNIDVDQVSIAEDKSLMNFDDTDKDTPKDTKLLHNANSCVRLNTDSNTLIVHSNSMKSSCQDANLSNITQYSSERGKKHSSVSQNQAIETENLNSESNKINETSDEDEIAIKQKEAKESLRQIILQKFTLRNTKNGQNNPEDLTELLGGSNPMKRIIESALTAKITTDSLAKKLKEQSIQKFKDGIPFLSLLRLDRCDLVKYQCNEKFPSVQVDEDQIETDITTFDQKLKSTVKKYYSSKIGMKQETSVNKLERLFSRTNFNRQDSSFLCKSNSNISSKSRRNIQLLSRYPVSAENIKQRGRVRSSSTNKIGTKSTKSHSYLTSEQLNSTNFIGMGDQYSSKRKNSTPDIIKSRNQVINSSSSRKLNISSPKLNLYTNINFSKPSLSSNKFNFNNNQNTNLLTSNEQIYQNLNQSRIVETSITDQQLKVNKIKEKQIQLTKNMFFNQKRGKKTFKKK